MKAKKIGAILLASVMAVSMVPAMSVSAADAKRVCFVARASSDTFSAGSAAQQQGFFSASVIADNSFPGVSV